MLLSVTTTLMSNLTLVTAELTAASMPAAIVVANDEEPSWIGK